MDTEEKLELIAAIVEARERTKFGLQSYHEMRNRVVKLDYNMGSKKERLAVNIFYEKVEDAELGPQMEKTASGLEALFKDVAELCAQNPLVDTDAEFSDILLRFVQLLDDWRPLSDACKKIADQVMTELEGDADV